METRASYVLVGLFTLLVMAGTIAAALWLAKIEIDREFALYDIHFSDGVPGLAVAAPVLLNGVPVGEVAAITLDPIDPAVVRVRVRLDATTPIRADSVAQLSTRGLTGIAEIAIRGGDPQAPLTRPQPGTIGEIVAGRSTVQEVLDTAPDLVAGASRLVTRAGALFSDENQANISALLANLATVTGTLARNEGAIDSIVADVGETIALFAKAAARLERVTAGVEGLVDDTRTLVQSADGTVRSMDDQLEPLLREVSATATSIRRLTDRLAIIAESAAPGVKQISTGGLIEVGNMIREARELIGTLDRVATRIERNPASFLLGGQDSELQLR